MTNADFYQNELYPFQDRVLDTLAKVDTGFYLTGGTAVSRAYLNHRYSDDLDFFVNDDANFSLWASRIIQALNQKWETQVFVQEERFARLQIVEKNLSLKIEMINDVPAHTGKITVHPTLGKLDSAENILANKVTALFGRNEPKDLVDIWGFCFLANLSLKDAITNAQGKAAGVFPADLARILCTAEENDLTSIRWIKPPDTEKIISQLNELGESLILP